jgi:hypothetical protein
MRRTVPRHLLRLRGSKEDLRVVALSAEFYARLLDCKLLGSLPKFVMFEVSPDLRAWARPPSRLACAGSAADTGELAMAVATNEEVEALCADRKSKGATILPEPVTKDFGLTFLATDPDRHRLRVFCPAP